MQLKNSLPIGTKILEGKQAFRLYDTFGFPLDLTQDILKKSDIKVDLKGFEIAFDKHKEVSKQGMNATKGGLLDHSSESIKLHTATHLLHKALQTILGVHALQRGSHITCERLRFDFVHPQKVSQEELKAVANLVNQQIEAALPVEKHNMSLEQAKEAGATALFAEKYGQTVSVYKIGDFSMEVCGGPHVENTKELGHFKILKEEASSKGVRRIKAILAP